MNTRPETTVTERSGVVLIALDGVFRMSREHLAPLSAEVAKNGARVFIVNLERRPFMNSAGLGELVHAHTNARRSGGRLLLIHVHLRIRTLLMQVGIVPPLEILESLSDALDKAGVSLATWNKSSG
jgi:anti-anti-sigma factor